MLTVGDVTTVTSSSPTPTKRGEKMANLFINQVKATLDQKKTSSLDEHKSLPRGGTTEQQSLDVADIMPPMRRRRKNSAPDISKVLLQLPPGGGSRRMGRRSTVHYSAAAFQLPIPRKDLAANEKEMKVLEQLRHICRDYIIFRLKKCNIDSYSVQKKQSMKGHEPLEKWLVQDILFVTHQLERKYQDIFQDISKQLGITLRSEEICRKVLLEICSEILITEAPKADKEKERRTSLESSSNNTNNNSDRKTSTKKGRSTIDWAIPSVQVVDGDDDEPRKMEITWGRVCAIIVVAANLASETVRQGHGDLVDSIVDSCIEFAYSEEVGKWIEQQGGWQTLRHLTRVGHANTRSNYAVDHHKLAKAYNIVFASLAIAFVICSILLFLVSLIR